LYVCFITNLIYKNLVIHVLSLDLVRLYNIGFLLGCHYILQILSGVCLALNYCPDMVLSFFEVHLSHDSEMSYILRATHVYVCTLVFGLMYLHVYKGIAGGLSEYGTTLACVLTGMLVFVLTIGIAFFGYVLPLSSMSYWGLVVFSNIMGAIPIVGDLVLSWLWGGEFIGVNTLSKIYALHVILPLFTLFLLICHMAALHASLSTDSFSTGHLMYNAYFSCIHLYQDLSALFVIGVIFSSVLSLYWNFALHEESFILFDPLKTSSKIIPEWFLLGFFGALKSVPSKIWGLIWLLTVMVAMGVLALTPIGLTPRACVFSESLYLACSYSLLSVIAASVVLLFPLLELLVWINLLLFYKIFLSSI